MTYFYRHNNAEYGPVDGATLKALVTSGDLLVTDEIRRSTDITWITAGRARHSITTQALRRRIH